MVKAKFITKQLEYYGLAGDVKITRKGLVTEDEKLIDALEKSRDFGKWYFRVPVEEEKQEKILGGIQHILIPPVEVTPLSAVNIAEEEAALAEEQRIRTEQAEAEAKIKEEKKAKQERNAAIRAARSGNGKKKEKK